MQPDALVINPHKGISLHVHFALHKQLFLVLIKSYHTIPG